MRVKRGNNSRPEESISEQFVYFLKLVVYPNSSNVNELGEMPAVTLERFTTKNEING